MEDGQFDPKGNHGGGDGDDLPSFEGILALVWFERRPAKSGGTYMRGKYEVCVGPLAGKTFFANQSLDPTKAGGRLSVWCAAIGHESPFDLSNDKDVRSVFLRKPFKASVERAVNGKYTNHDIKKFTLPSKLTDGDRKAMQGWVLDAAEKQALSGKGDEDDGDDVEDMIPF